MSEPEHISKILSNVMKKEQFQKKFKLTDQDMVEIGKIVKDKKATFPGKIVKVVGKK